MTHNNFIYIAVMALVSYAIRVLPLTLIRKPIKNQFIQSFILRSICDAGCHDISCDCRSNTEPCSRRRCTRRRYPCSMVWCKSVSGVCGMLCGCVCDRVVFVKLFCMADRIESICDHKPCEAHHPRSTQYACSRHFILCKDQCRTQLTS